MLDNFFNIIFLVDEFYWQYVGFLLLILAGLYFSYKSGFFQIRVIGKLPSTIKYLYKEVKEERPGVSPLRLYFASIGGMIGVGNISGAVIALLIGGPGALFWLWVAALAGMIIKYCEIYLGIKYRTQNAHGYDGGLMFCMPEAFKGKLGIFLAYFSAFLLCIYGAEVYQFTVIVDTLDEVIPISREWLILPLLGLIVYIGLGGIKRLADVCAFLMPGFIVLYVAMCAWVIGMHYELLPTLIADVFKSAFMGHAALGGFAGSTIIMAAQQGAQRAVYSGDIAVGFDSIIQSETKELNPQRQARLAIVAALSDAFICTLSIVVVYMTGLWKMGGNLLASNLVATSLEAHIPYADWLIVLIIFLAGFTTIQAYFSVGLKAAKFISRRWGRLSYFIYAIASLWVFSHYDQTTVIVIMSLSGGLLILVNISCIFKLRKEIRFDVLKEDSGE